MPVSLTPSENSEELIFSILPLTMDFSFITWAIVAIKSYLETAELLHSEKYHLN